MNTNSPGASSTEIRTSAEQEADPRVDLAVLRTELALDRTQLAWVRTAFTLITTGLALDKGAEALHQARVLAGTNWVKGSHVIGPTLTVAATAFLVITSVEYFRRAWDLARLKGGRPSLCPPALLVSVMVILLGIALSIVLLTWD